MIELNKYEQQIVLACKGWSNQDDTTETIRNILAQQFGLKVAYIDHERIYKCLYKLAKTLDNKSLEKVIYNLFECYEINVDDVIDSLIGIIASVQVKDGDKELLKLEYDEEIMNWVEV